MNEQHPFKTSPHPHKVPADLSQFWVVTVVSNPVRYKRRYELYWRFAEMCHQAGVNLVTVEQAFGDRPFMVTTSDNKNHLQVRSSEELWHKENMIRMGMKHAHAIAPGRVREFAWIDADCFPARSNPAEWFHETWHALQHYKFVQMWEHLLDLTPDQSPVGGFGVSFMSNFVKYGTPYPKNVGTATNGVYAPSWGSPGLAWAASVSALSEIGGIPEHAILGAGDWYLAHMLTTGLPLKDMEKYSPGYRDAFLRQQQRCERWIKGDVGFVPGLVLHDWHGKKVNRFYNSREKILIENQYDPHTDIKYDAQGHLQLETWEPRQIKMRDQIRQYFRARNEDGIDL